MLRTMMVGQDARSADVIRRVMVGAGFECVEVPDGIKAIQQSSDHGIDLVIFRMDMDRLSGSELITLIWRGVFGSPPPPMVVCGTPDEIARLKASADYALVHAALVLPLDAEALSEALFSAVPTS